MSNDCPSGEQCSKQCTDLLDFENQEKKVIRSRADFGSISGLLHDVMSFYENGPEYDMTKVLARKNVQIKQWSRIVQVDGGYLFCGVEFKFPEDFPVDCQIPKEDTIAFWTEKEQKTKRVLQEKMKINALYEEIRNKEQEREKAS